MSRVTKRPEADADLLEIAVYVVFYRPTPSGIDVVRVLSGARDIPALF